MGRMYRLPSFSRIRALHGLIEWPRNGFDSNNGRRELLLQHRTRVDTVRRDHQHARVSEFQQPVVEPTTIQVDVRE